MKPFTRKLIISFLINALITFPLFYFFEENRQCITDFGSSCSNKFLVRCMVQVAIVSVVMVFTMKPKKTEKQ